MQDDLNVDEELQANEPYVKQESRKFVADEKPTLCNPGMTLEDLTGMPEFPAGTKSSLCRNLSKEDWEMYKDKAGTYDYSF